MINGPAGQQLGTGPDSMPNTLGAVNFNLGVIAGSRSNNPLFSSLINEASDGKVSLSSTKVDGMHQHLCMDVDHTFMMNNMRVIQQVRHFLQTGSFSDSL